MFGVLILLEVALMGLTIYCLKHENQLIEAENRFVKIFLRRNK